MSALNPKNYDLYKFYVIVISLLFFYSMPQINKKKVKEDNVIIDTKNIESWVKIYSRRRVLNFYEINQRFLAKSDDVLKSQSWDIWTWFKKATRLCP